MTRFEYSARMVNRDSNNEIAIIIIFMNCQLKVQMRYVDKEKALIVVLNCRG